MPRRPRILFVGEAVTMAHIARPATLANLLDPQRYEIIFAAAQRTRRYAPASAAFEPIHSLEPEVFLRRLYRLRPVITPHELDQAIQEDFRLLDRTSPDAVISDFRLSLGISARIRGIPLLTISNMHWQPSGEVPAILAHSWLAQLLGPHLGQAVFQRALPIGLRAQLEPFNRIRQKYGLSVLTGDVRNAYTDGDCILYADMLELFPSFQPKPNEHTLGPIISELPVVTPSWWDSVPSTRPTVFFAMGSSGNTSSYLALLRALADMPITVMTACGSRMPHDLGSNVFAAPLLPPTATIRRCDIVIANGGSPMGYHAFSLGKPLLALTSNLDQQAFAEAAARYGAGMRLLSTFVKGAHLRQAVEKLLVTQSFSIKAQELQRAMSTYDTKAVLDEILAGLTGQARSRPLAAIPTSA